MLYLTYLKLQLVTANISNSLLLMVVFILACLPIHLQIHLHVQERALGFLFYNSPLICLTKKVSPFSPSLSEPRSPTF